MSLCAVKRLHILDAAGGYLLVTEWERIESSPNLLLHKDERDTALLSKECGLMTCWHNTKHLRFVSYSNNSLKRNHCKQSEGDLGSINFKEQPYTLWINPSCTAFGSLST